MTVNTTTSRVSYAGNGSTTTFSVPFYFLAAADLVVIRTASNGVQTTLVLNTDYTVTGAGNPAGGSVVCTTAPALATSLVIFRDPAATQLTDYQANDPFPAETHERALDKLTMLAQRLKDLVARSLTLSDGDTTTASTTLPSPSADKLIGWNETATALQNVDPITIATQVTTGTARADLFSGDGVQTAFTLSDNPGAQANLDVSVGGVTQRLGIDFLWSTGTTLTFTSAPPSGTNNILVRYWQGLPQNAAQAAPFTPAGAEAVERTIQSKLRDTVSVKDFGAVGDGVTDDTVEIQAAIDYAETISTTFSRGAEVLFPPGEYVTSAPLVIGANGVKLKGSGVTSTIIRYTGASGAAIQADGVLRTACRVEGMTIRQDTAGGNGIDFTWFSYSDFENLAFDMRAATQVGIYAAGNGLGTGPYYNTFDKIHIIGQPATAGQIGVQLAPASSGGFLADGPNANLFSNFRRISLMDVGFDIQSGNGNIGNNISMEEITDYGFAFNNRPADYTGTATSGTAGGFSNSAAPFVTASLGGGAWKIVGGTGSGESGSIRTSTTTTISTELYNRTGVVFDATSQYEVYKSKAVGNKFTGVRIEGANTSAAARFYAGALNNTITQTYITSISTTYWEKDVAEASNWCHTQASSQLIAVPMWKEGSLTAGTTHGLNPNTTATLGSGFRFLPKNANVVGMSVSCDSLSGVTGSAIVRLFKSNVAFTDLDITLNTNTAFGNHSYIQNFVISSGARFEPQNDMDVRIITDGSWNGTSRQISVLLWVQV